MENIKGFVRCGRTPCYRRWALATPAYPLQLPTTSRACVYQTHLMTLSARPTRRIHKYEIRPTCPCLGWLGKNRRMWFHLMKGCDFGPKAHLSHPRWQKAKTIPIYLFSKRTCLRVLLPLSCSDDGRSARCRRIWAPLEQMCSTVIIGF